MKSSDLIYYRTAPYHGYDGPLVVENKKWGSKVMSAFLRAGEELGYPTIDPNAESQIGLSVRFKI